MQQPAVNLPPLPRAGREASSLSFVGPFTPPMAAIWTKAKRSEVMARIRGRGNRTTEVRLAAIFRAHGIKVRVRRSASKG